MIYVDEDTINSTVMSFHDRMTEGIQKVLDDFQSQILEDKNDKLWEAIKSHIGFYKEQTDPQNAMSFFSGALLIYECFRRKLEAQEMEAP